jgi:hypothetical protein
MAMVLAARQRRSLAIDLLTFSWNQSKGTNATTLQFHSSVKPDYKKSEYIRLSFDRLPST